MGFFQPSGILNRKGFFGGAAFSPKNISGLQLWLDATTGLFDATSGGSAVTTDGSAVARWEDQSGNGNHFLQGTSNNRPVLKTLVQNSKNIIRFDGINDFFSKSTIALTKCTIFIAMSSSKTDTRQILIQWGDNTSDTPNQLHFWIRNSRYACFFRDSSGLQKEVAQSSDKNSSFVSLSATFDSTASFHTNDLQGTTQTFNGTLNTTNSGMGIGVKVNNQQNPTNASYLDGDIGEILIYNSALISANRTSVFDYLKSKWGIT